MKNTFGFSILELMIAVGISGMAAVGVMQMTEDQLKVQKRVTTEFDADTLVNVVQKIIVNRGSCNATFSGRNINVGVGNETQIPQILAPDGATVLMSVGNPYGEIDIVDMNFVFRGQADDPVKVNVAGVPINAEKIVGEIEIQARKRSVLTNPNNGVLVRRLPYPIELLIGPGNTVLANDGCTPAVKDVDEDVAEAFCRMITNDNVGIAAPGGPCDTTLTAGETSATVDDPTPGGGGSSLTRALSFGTLEDQIGGDDSDGGGLIRNLGANTDPNIFSDSGDTMGKFVQLAGGNVNSINFNGGANPSLVINGNSFSGNELINAQFLDSRANLERTSTCTGSNRLGIPSTGGRVCMSNTCTQQQYSGGIVNDLGCNNYVQPSTPTCWEGQGEIFINGSGELDFRC